MIDVKQFRAEVIRPTLEHIGAWSPVAEDLMVGTAVQESRLTYLRQIGGGPALGVFQVEPATERDIWDNFLAYRDKLSEKVARLVIPGLPRTGQMTANLAYACAVARIVYYRRPEPLPEHGDVQGYGDYWKAHYNTPLGAGTAAEFVHNWNRYVEG